MTLPQNVADALDTIWSATYAGSYERTACNTIRAHLMSQEAEIARLNDAVDRLQQLWSENAPAVEYKRRALLAESRLAAANALLWDCIAYIDMRVEGGEELYEAVRNHLQGAGDEA